MVKSTRFYQIKYAKYLRSNLFMLDIYPLLLLFTAVVFLGLLVFLNKTVYRPLLGFMDNRDDVIEKDRKHSNKNESDIAAYEEEARAIILDAKSDISKTRADEIAKVKEEIEKKIDIKKSELEEEYALFQKRLQEEAKDLKNGLLAQMPLYKEGIKAKLNQL